MGRVVFRPSPEEPTSKPRALVGVLRHPITAWDSLSLTDRITALLLALAIMLGGFGMVAAAPIVIGWFAVIVSTIGAIAVSSPFLVLLYVTACRIAWKVLDR